MTFLCTRDFACTSVRAKPFYVHENQCTQIISLSSSAITFLEYILEINVSRNSFVFYKSSFYKSSLCKKYSKTVFPQVRGKAQSSAVSFNTQIKLKAPSDKCLPLTTESKFTWSHHSLTGRLSTVM